MKILMPVDGSESANLTLAWAAETLNPANVRIVLLSVISETMIAEYKLEDARKVLEDGKAYLTGRGFTVEKAEYLTGDPTEQICRYAEEEDVDQVLVGSHGRSGLAKVLLGSVSEALLKHCKKPVFIYRSTQDQMAGSPL